MPNTANIDRPIVLVGQGRSGTSLVSGLFSQHPDCSAVGETLNLIFGVWSAIRVSTSVVLPLIDGERAVPDDERAGRLVREAFLASFPDDRAYWMQKPIGIPRAFAEMYGKDRGGREASALYWRVLHTTFPNARYITLLRHPCDVVLSGLAHWGKDQRTLWRSLADLARYFVHPEAPPVHGIVYERLVTDQETTVRELCEAVQLPFDPAMLRAFGEIYVAAPGRSDPQQTKFSRRHEWDQLNPAWLLPDEREIISAMFARFGHDIEWPAPFLAPRAAAAGRVSDAERIADLNEQLQDLKLAFERVRLEHADRWQAREDEIGLQSQAREQEFSRIWQAYEEQVGQRWQAREEESTRLWNEQRDWIAELERAKAWHEQQAENWRAEAERLRRNSRQQ